MRRGWRNRPCLALVIAACGTLSFCRGERPASKQLASAYAAQSRRPLMLRLSGLPYAPAPRMARGAAAEPDAELKSVAYGILANSSVDILPYATAALLTGNLSQAEASLRVQLKREPRRADLWNDLAVTLYEIARHEDRPGTLAASLAAVDQALALASSFAEAAFNRSVILDSLALRAAGAKSWQTYLALDPGSRWAAEARQALELDRRPTAAEQWKQVQPALEWAARKGDLAFVDSVIDSHAQQVRTSGEGEYLSRWAEQSVALKKDAAADALLIARVLGDRLAIRHGETLLRSAVDAVDARPDQAENLARAYVAYKRGRILIKDRRPSESDALLAEAERRFAASGSPMEAVARYFRAGIAFDLRNAEKAVLLLDGAEAQLRPGFQALRAQILWERSRILGRRDDLYGCLVAASTAAQMFERLGEPENAARNHHNAAGMLSDLGRPDDSWRLRLRVFESASATGGPGFLGLALNNTAAAEIRDGRFDVARSLLDVALESDSTSPLVFYTRLARAVAGHRLGERDAPSLALLSAAAVAISDPALRAEADDHLRFFEALAVRDTDPSRAIRLLEDAIVFRSQARRLSPLAEARFERARAFAKIGAGDAAVVDLDAALAALETQRVRVRGGDLRDSFFASADGICDELVSLHHARGELDLAFAAVNRCRNRLLADLTSRAAGIGSATTVDVQRRLPENAAAVVYAPLEDRLLVWVVTPSRSESVAVPVRRAQLQQWASELTGAIDRRDERALRVAQQHLSGALVAPVERSIELPEKLFLVSDAIIAGIPMALLQDRAGRFLIVGSEIVSVPSVAAFTDEERPYTIPADALVIGDPALAQDRVRPLPRLPDAAREARKIAGLYRQSVLLLGEEATPQRFFQRAPASDLVHIGAHAILSARDARDSLLLLAPSRDETGAVTLQRIASMRMRPDSIVLLAGCETGAFGGGLGSIRSLAYAFLAAGSGAVVGSLWDIDDDTSRVFMTAFHRRIRSGVAPSAALRETQLEMLGSSNPRIRDAAAWAAFQLYAN